MKTKIPKEFIKKLKKELLNNTQYGDRSDNIKIHIEKEIDKLVKEFENSDEYLSDMSQSKSESICKNCGEKAYNHLNKDGIRSSRGIYCDETKSKKFKAKSK